MGFKVITGHLVNGEFVPGPDPRIQEEDDRFDAMSDEEQDAYLEKLKKERDEDTERFSAKDLFFDVASIESTWGNDEIVTAVFITDASGEADNLGNHNVVGLPEYFDYEESECYWEIMEKDVDTVKADMIAAGFTYQKMDDWHE